MLKFQLATALCALLTLASAQAGAAPHPLARFVEDPQVANMKLSPDGKYLAFRYAVGGATGVRVLQAADMKPVGGGAAPAGGRAVISDFWWVGSEWVVASVAQSDGSIGAPTDYGELVSFRYDGTHQNYLGYRGRQQTGTHITAGQAIEGSVSFIGAMANDSDAMLVSVHPWRGPVDFDILNRVDLNSGRLTRVGAGPVRGRAQFTADMQGRVRFAIAAADDGVSYRTFARDSDAGQWRPIDTAGRGDVIPLRISKDGSRVYLTAANDHGLRCLAEQRLDGDEGRFLACHETADLDHVIFSDVDNRPLVAVFQPGGYEYRWLDDRDPEGKPLFEGLSKALGGRMIEPTSWSRDGQKIVLRAYSDRDPGEYFLLDRAARKLEPLLVSREGIDPGQMASRTPIEYRGRDGATLHGYVTAPPGATGKLPMIVLPHGGPFWIRDDWRWNAEAQLFASRGYLVLQPNFRGSAGYGAAYVEAARRGWGTTMIADISDAARWAIDNAMADPTRVCIYGASYGAYAALSSAEQEPDLYRCVVAYAGVYDLPLLRRHSDINDDIGGRAYFERYIGSDPQHLQALSPVRFVERLKAPVLIIHGEADQRAPYDQAKALRGALESADRPYEWLSKAQEGHGFYALENRIEAYERMLDFFAEHLGGGAADQ